LRLAAEKQAAAAEKKLALKIKAVVDLTEGLQDLSDRFDREFDALRRDNDEKIECLKSLHVRLRGETARADALSKKVLNQESALANQASLRREVALKKKCPFQGLARTCPP
jgi:hypothetical protein